MRSGSACLSWRIERAAFAATAGRRIDTHDRIDLRGAHVLMSDLLNDGDVSFAILGSMMRMISFPDPLRYLGSCIVLTCTVASVLVDASPQPRLSRHFIRASISVNRPSFVVGRDEVDVSFEAV